MKIVAALDSFKGSLSSQDACEAVLQGCKRALHAAGVSDFTGLSVPISDGGEGLIACLKPLLLPQGYEEVSVSVLPPVLERKAAANAETDETDIWTLPPTTAHFLRRGHECVIESAQALGLTLVPEDMRHIRLSSSYCLGQVLKAALELGCTDIKIGLGGTCTNDCGIGMAQALGVSFSLKGLNGDTTTTTTNTATASTSANFPYLTAQHLGQIESINAEALEARIANYTHGPLKVTGLTDVTNPLIGPQGATHVFAPQKGASPEDIEFLEKGMCSFAQVLEKHYGRELTYAQGAGAAGGLGAALLYFLHGELKSGIDALLDILDFEALLQDCDLVLVGEGALDEQSLAGKAPVGVAKRAAAKGIPVIALAGKVSAPEQQLQQHHIARAFGLINSGLTPEDAMRHAAHHLAALAENTLTALLKESHGRPLSALLSATK